MQRNHRMNALTSKLWYGGAELHCMWPSNHFRLYTARCIVCTEAQETRAPCMFDWQGIHTWATYLLPLWKAKLQIQSLVCTLRNSNDHSKCELCSRVKTVQESLIVNSGFQDEACLLPLYMYQFGKWNPIHTSFWQKALHQTKYLTNVYNYMMVYI